MAEGIKKLRVSTITSDNVNVSNILSQCDTIILDSPKRSGSLNTEEPVISDDFFNKRGKAISFSPTNISLAGTSSYLMDVSNTTPNSVQSYYPNINTILTGSETYYVPCLRNKDYTSYDSASNIAYNNTPFIFLGLHSLFETHGTGVRDAFIPFSGSSGGNLTNQWRLSEGNLDVPKSYTWAPTFVYPSPLKVSISASVSSSLPPGHDVTSSLYLAAVGIIRTTGGERGNIRDELNRTSFVYNLCGPVLISSSVGEEQDVNFYLELTQSYSRVFDSIIGVNYSTRNPRPQTFANSYPTAIDQFGWSLQLITDATHSTGDDHNGGTSPYVIHSESINAEIDWLYRRDSSTYIEAAKRLPVSSSDVNIDGSSAFGIITSSTYNAGDKFELKNYEDQSDNKGYNGEYMVINKGINYDSSYNTWDGIFNNSILSRNIRDKLRMPRNSLSSNKGDWAPFQWVNSTPVIVETGSAIFNQIVTTSSLVLISPNIENFASSDFNPVLNNSQDQVESNKFFKIEYDSDLITPSNINLIQNRTAQKADIADSLYARNSWIKGRYKGTRVSSNNFNIKF